MLGVHSRPVFTVHEDHKDAAEVIACHSKVVSADVVEPAFVTPLTEVLRAAPMQVDEVSFLVDQVALAAACRRARPH